MPDAKGKLLAIRSVDLSMFREYDIDSWRRVLSAWSVFLESDGLNEHSLACMPTYARTMSIGRQSAKMSEVM